MIDEMMGKKNGKKDDMKKEAKLSVLKELRKMASDMIGGDLKEGMNKVTVASDSKEGLKKGLEKAEDLMEQAPDMEEELEDEEMEYEDMEEESDEDEMSPEDIEAKIQELMEKKKKLSK